MRPDAHRWIRGCVLLAALLATAVAPTSAAAQAPSETPRLDPEDPCASPGLPAISRSGRRVAIVRCESDLSDAFSATFVVLSTADGRELQSLLLSRCGPGCEDRTALETVRRRAERGATLLSEGGFSPLLPVPGFADGAGDGTVAGRRALFDSARAEVRVLDASGRLLLARRLAGIPGNPYCCGLEPDDATRCVRPPAVWGIWLDASGQHLLVQVGTSSGVPDGCEVGPRYLVLAL